MQCRTRWIQAGLAVVLLSAFNSATLPAWGWGGGHSCITRVAITLLPPEDLTLVGPERVALETVYCGFPDSNASPRDGAWAIST